MYPEEPGLVIVAIPVCNYRVSHVLPPHPFWLIPVLFLEAFSGHRNARNCFDALTKMVNLMAFSAAQCKT
jgi:hypothetical protein